MSLKIGRPAYAVGAPATKWSGGNIETVRTAYQEVAAEMSALAIGARPARANHGNTSLLRWNLGRCFDSEANSRDTVSKPAALPELRVLVVGCSMTQGFMNCGSHEKVKMCTIPCDAMAWYRLLERRLQRGLPGCNVKMFRTTSRGGRTVTTAQRYETRVRRAAKNPHVIITDLTVCDLRGITSSLDEVRVQAGWETLIRTVLAEESAPALVQMESWSSFSPMGPCLTNKTEAHKLHLPLAVHYGVPVASFMMGVCAHRPEVAQRRHWRGGCSGNASTCGGAFGVRGLNTPGLECEPHPGPHTHRVYALILAELILGEAKRMMLSAARSATREGHLTGQTTPIALPPRPAPLDAASTPSVLPASALSDMSGCRAHHGVSNALVTLDFAESACGEPVRQAGWRCYEDRPGKRGWISEDASSNTVVGTTMVADGRGEPLTFAVPLGSSRLTVAYLRSYDARMGTAKVWLDDDESAAAVINGSWTSRTSQTDITAVRMSTLCGESCKARRRGEQHHVHVQRTSGRKFKLLLLEVC